MSPLAPPFARGGGFGTLGSSFLEPALPPSPSLAPATWGAWLSLALLLLGLGWGVALLLRRHARRRHRRAARRELRALQGTWQSADPTARAATLESLPRLLKGCALGSFERGRVAPLAGRAWLEFLRHTGPGAGFEGPPGDTLVALCERGAHELPAASVPALFAATERWIAGHRV